MAKIISRRAKYVMQLFVTLRSGKDSQQTSPARPYQVLCVVVFDSQVEQAYSSAALNFFPADQKSPHLSRLSSLLYIWTSTPAVKVLSSLAAVPHLTLGAYTA